MLGAALILHATLFVVLGCLFLAFSRASAIARPPGGFLTIWFLLDRDGVVDEWSESTSPVDGAWIFRSCDGAADGGWPRGAAACAIASASPSKLRHPNCSPRPHHTESSPAPPSRRCVQILPSRGTHTRARGPPSCADGRLPCRCSTSGPSCPPRTPPPRPRRRPRTSAGVILLGAACLFYWFVELVVALLPVSFLAAGPQ